MEVITIAIFYLASSGLIATVTGEDDGFGNDLWRRKFKTFMMSLDHDSDGFLTYEEVESVKDTLKNLYKGKNKDLIDIFNQLYDEFWHLIAGNPSGDARVSYDQLADGMQAAGQAQCQSVLGKIVHILFTITDTNGDDEIESDEMQGLMTAFLQTKPSDVDAAFKEIDINKDGHITEDEFTTHHMEYFCTGSTRPGEGAFGPLVD